MDAANREYNGFGKVDLSKSEPAGPEITRVEMVGLGDNRAEDAKPDKANAKDATKRVQPHRNLRALRYSYSDSLRPN
jgi:hypothetical protein